MKNMGMYEDMLCSHAVIEVSRSLACAPFLKIGFTSLPRLLVEDAPCFHNVPGVATVVLDFVVVTHSAGNGRKRRQGERKVEKVRAPDCWERRKEGRGRK